jgi:proteic killer suppression protein
MIRSLADDEAEKLWNLQRSRKLPQDIQQRALTKLAMIHHATNLNDLKVPPANRLELLTGNRSGQYSVLINRQWRICFQWEGGDACDVEIVDYH